MSTNERLLTTCKLVEGVDFIFASLDRRPTSDECRDLVEKYFDKHQQMTLPGKPLFIDLRPAFRKPLASVTPKIYALNDLDTPPKA